MQVLEWSLYYAFIMGCGATACWYFVGGLCVGELNSLNKGKKVNKYMMRVASTRKAGPGYQTPYAEYAAPYGRP